MLIREFRVILPFTVEEYQVAQLFSVSEASKRETGGGEGVEIIKNEPFTDYPLLNGKYSSGQYTFKMYHLQHKVPGIIRLVAPKGSLTIHEEAWNAYPYCRTIINNPGYMKNNFKIVIESFHVPGNDILENAHELTAKQLKERQVEYIDIANDPVNQHDYKLDEDPTKFCSQKTGRGPLSGDWTKQVEPVMTCYKLVTVEFKWLGLQNRVEQFIQNFERRIFLNFHRQVFCWIDRWYGLTMEDIRRIEDETKKELETLRKEDVQRGTRLDD